MQFLKVAWDGQRDHQQILLTSRVPSESPGYVPSEKVIYQGAAVLNSVTDSHTFRDTTGATVALANSLSAAIARIRSTVLALLDTFWELSVT